jgi:uncharacterized protein YjbI with pentapeptide repeats
LIHDRLPSAIGNYLTNTGAFARNPLDRQNFATLDQRLILIFDGLDELTKPGDLAETEVRRFLAELRMTLAQWNQDGCRIVAIVTGRTPIVQATSDVVRVAPRQELDVLRFLTQTSDKYDDPEHLLDADQRKSWWVNYSTCKMGSPTEIPRTLLHPDLEELSAEPLLIYLLVLSGFHLEAVEGGTLNRNVIYSRLFSGVQERKYESAPVGARQILKDQFEEVMEAVATAAWYGDGRTATIDDVRARCPERLAKIIDEFLLKSGGFHRLIAAFYFQSTERGVLSGQAFEFTHKSFGEYLTARRLIREIKDINGALALERDFYTIRNAVEDWFTLCSEQPMDSELFRFLRDELAMPDWQQQLPDWQDTLVRMMSFLLREGVPVRALEHISFRRAELQMRNAEEALLAALSTCSKLTGRLARLGWRNEHAAGAMVHRLRGQRYMPMNSVALASLSFLDLVGQNFMVQDLYRANFSGSDLTGCDFFNADLREADFTGAKITKGNFEDAWIHNATFFRANLEGCNFSEVRGDYQQFLLSNRIDKDSEDDLLINRQRDFDRIDFKEAVLKGAFCAVSNLSKADFRHADLEEADFRGAKLRGALFAGAKLSGARFNGAKLAGVDIEISDFDDAEINEADFADVGIIEAEYARRLEEAQLPRLEQEEEKTINKVLTE